MERRFIIIAFMVTVFVPMVTAYEVNLEIAANIAEGEALLDEINRLLNDRSLTSSIKQGIEFSVDLLVETERGAPMATLNSVSAFSSGAMFKTANNDLVIPVQSQCEETCCKVILPPATLTRSNRVTYRCLSYYTERYSTSCGFAGWNRCRRSRTRSASSTCTRYETLYYQQDQSNRACPSVHLTCCKGYITYQNCCVAISRLREIIEEAKRLQAGCDSGWVSSRVGSCYLFVEGGKNWNDARSDCQNQGADLAQITTPDKASKMMTIRSEIGKANNYYWVGAKQTAVRQRSFTWTSGGDINSALWFSGEPNQANSNSLMCVDIATPSQQSKLCDYACSASLSYVCEK